jgi:hypothetical protein
MIIIYIIIPYLKYYEHSDSTPVSKGTVYFLFNDRNIHQKYLFNSKNTRKTCYDSKRVKAFCSLISKARKKNVNINCKWYAENESTYYVHGILQSGYSLLDCWWQ